MKGVKKENIVSIAESVQLLLQTVFVLEPVTMTMKKIGFANLEQIKSIKKLLK